MDKLRVAMRICFTKLLGLPLVVVLAMGMLACEKDAGGQQEANTGDTPNVTPDQPGGGETPTPPATTIPFDWVLVPEGSFTMGSPTTEKDRHVDETQHAVRISAFWMSKYEVTNAQYDAFLKATKTEKPAVYKKANRQGTKFYKNSREFKREKQPVVWVDREVAEAFCEWAGVQLPTEAQWEYACRAGSQARFGMGKDGEQITEANFGDYAWNEENTKEAGKKQTTREVGTRKANAYGLHDMHGNVWEWCRDTYNPKFYATDAAKGPDPVFREEGSGQGVCRGGAFFFYSNVSRCAHRESVQVSYKDKLLGFRVVVPVAK